MAPPLLRSARREAPSRATKLAKSQYPDAFKTPNPRTDPGRRTELHTRWTPHENRGNLPRSQRPCAPRSSEAVRGWSGPRSALPGRWCSCSCSPAGRAEMGNRLEKKKWDETFFFCCCSESKTTRGDLRKQRLRSRIICRPTLGRIPLWAYLFWHGFSRLYSSIAFAIAAPAATVSSPFLVGIRESPWRTTHLVPPRRYKGRGMQGKAAAEGSSV
jgi:hypothetical protein